MPHFVIECSENIIRIKSPKEIIQKVYDTAETTNLFDKGDIKVRRESKVDEFFPSFLGTRAVKKQQEY
jgi:5-carboxymethyl-2-hydroxymuconate isomerase